MTTRVKCSQLLARPRGRSETRATIASLRYNHEEVKKELCIRDSRRRSIDRVTNWIPKPNQKLAKKEGGGVKECLSVLSICSVVDIYKKLYRKEM